MSQNSNCDTCGEQVDEFGTCSNCALKQFLNVSDSETAIESDSDLTHVQKTNETTLDGLFTVSLGSVSHYGATITAPPETSKPENGRLPKDRYTVEKEPIGHGGMGVVYKAQDNFLRRTVALKLLRKDKVQNSTLKRLFEEARVLSQLKHENIVELYDLNVVNGQPYIAMEHLTGTPISELIVDKKPLDPTLAAKIVLAMARGVQAAHQQKILHRDIKPSNAFLCDSGTVKLLDFGLAKQLDTDEKLTLTGEWISGTPGYLAPEVITPKFAPDHRIDVWGLAATLYQLTTGETPYPLGANNAYKVLTTNAPWPRTRNANVPPVLEAITMMGLQKDVAKRYQTAQEFGDDLQRWLNQERTVARPRTFGDRLRDSIKHIPFSTRAILLGLMLVAGIFSALAYMPQPTQKERYIKAMQSGGTIRVLGDQFNPGFTPKLLLRHGIFGENATTGHRASLTSNELGLCEIMENTATDHYRFSTEIQLQADIVNIVGPTLNTSRIGLYFNHSSHRVSDQETIHEYYAVLINPYDKRLKPGQFRDTKGTHICTIDHHVLKVNADPTKSGIQAGSFWHIPIRIAGDLPSNWHTIVVDANLKGFRVWVDRDPDSDEPSATVPVEGLRQQMNLGNLYINKDLQIPDFHSNYSPRNGVGFIVNTAQANYRNTKLQSFVGGGELQE